MAAGVGDRVSMWPNSMVGTSAAVAVGRRQSRKVVVSGLPSSS
jgi:hypothetical protein